MTSAITTFNFNDLERYESSRYSGALPSGVDTKRFTRLLTTYLRQNPALTDKSKCHPASLYSAIVSIAQLGLCPENFLGQAYIIPFKGKAQPMLGYKGMITLATKYAGVAEISAEVVYRSDDFKFSLGTNRRIHHEPNFEGVPKNSDITAFYATARFHDGTHKFAVLSKSDVDAIRKGAASARGSSPWDAYYAEMGKKTAIRRLFKTLAVLIDDERALPIHKAVAMEENFEAKGKVTIITPEGEVVSDEEEEKSAAQTLNEKLAKPEPDPCPEEDQENYTNAWQEAAKKHMSSCFSEASALCIDGLEPWEREVYQKMIVDMYQGRPDIKEIKEQAFPLKFKNFFIENFIAKK